ncbi:MAG: DUF6602 domain-containing protein [Saprospiraceae bacterium]
MSNPFYDRLNKYFENVGKVLRGEADAASIFPNTSDIGFNRELIYAKFLQQHAPSKCNVFLGGFLFGIKGEESKQLDVIITSDTAPRYNFYNEDGNGKSFGPVDGCICIASIKSMLDKEQLIDALYNIASIPIQQPLGSNVNPLFNVVDYENWPYKIVYASKGLNVETIIQHLNDFYSSNSNIPYSRRPDIIHVAGKYAIFRIKIGMDVTAKDGSIIKSIAGQFVPFNINPDLQAMLWILDNLQKCAAATNNISFNYTEIILNARPIE